MTITVQGTTFQSSVGTPWNIPSGVAMFVQAGSGGTVLDYDATRQRYMAEYGVDPLGQITPDPNAIAGSAAYALSQQHYLNNPSQRFQEQTNLYQQRQGMALTSTGYVQQQGSSPTPVYDMSTAAGIAAYTARQGGAITEDTARIAAREGYNTNTLNVISGRETIATPEKTYAADVARAGPAQILASDLSGPSATFYSPVGSYYKVANPDSKAVISAAGEIGIYSPYYINGQLSKYLILSSSGGRNALQSGMFTVNDPMGSDVLSRADLANFTPASASTIATKSRSGAEAYGGYEGITLDNRTIESTGAKLSTYANPANLANLVSPEAVNLGKAELPGAAFPWTISAGSPTIQFADQYGLTGKSLNIGTQAQKSSSGVLDLSAGTYSVIGGETTKYTPSVQVAGLESPVAKQIAGTNLYIQPLGTVESVFGTGTKAAAEQTPILDQVGSFLSGAVNFWTPAGIAGTKNVVEGSVPIAGDIPHIGSTINSVAAWITPQGMAQVTTPAGLQVQKDASAALSSVQTIKAQYDVAKGQYDTDIAAARAAGYINAQGEITDSKTYAKLSGEIDAVNVLSGKLNEANTKYTSVYDNAVKEGLYTVDKSGNYVPTTKAQSSAFDQIDVDLSNALKGTGFTVSTDYSKIEQKPVIQTPLYDIYQSFEKNIAQPFTIGAATEFQEKPASTGFNFAVGVGLAVATEGLGDLVGSSATLSRIGGIVSPTIYTTRAGTEIGLVPAALSGIYAASVPYRATDELTNFTPKEVSKNLGEILATETGPMIAGGYLGTVGYSKAAASLSQSNIWDTMAGRENAYTIETTPTKPISETIGDMVYAARQKSMGIENIGPKSGLTYYSENFETPWQTSEAARQTPAGISGYLNAVNPTYEEAVGGIYSKSTALTTVPYERTILGSAYDISYANAQYLPQEELLKLQTSRTVITPEGYGGIKVAEQFTPLTLSSEAYARATGIDLLPQTPSTSEVVDVFRTQTIRDVYPSGRTYENVVGRKGQAVLPGREVSDIISSRGITSGEFSTYQRMMSAADQMIETTIVKETPSRISVVDLPTTIKDISVGYGSTEISPLSGTSTMQQATRVVRAGENYETVFGREALNKMEVGAPLGVLFPGSERTVSGLFETLPEYGVKSTEVFGAKEGMRPAPVISSENIYAADKEISDLLYGQNAGRFGTEAQRLRETGTEKVLRSGFERSGGVITPLSKTFGKTRYGAPAESGGGKGNPALLMSGVSQEENLKTAQHIGSMIENVLGKSRAKEEATETQEQTTAEEIRSGLSAYSPRQALFEEDYGYAPSEQVLERVGLKARGATTRPAEEARMSYGAEAIAGEVQGIYGLSALSQRSEVEQARQSESTNLENFLFGQEVIPAVQSDILGKQATVQTERQTPREAQITDQSIIQDILGKQITAPDVAQDILGKQTVISVPALSILTGITLPRVTEVPPVEPVKVEGPKPTKITWPDLSSLAQGGAWGSGRLTGTVFTEKLKLRSMKEVLGVSTFQQQKRKR